MRLNEKASLGSSFELCPLLYGVNVPPGSNRLLSFGAHRRSVVSFCLAHGCGPLLRLRGDDYLIWFSHLRCGCRHAFTSQQELQTARQWVNSNQSLAPTIFPEECGSTGVRVDVEGHIAPYRARAITGPDHKPSQGDRRTLGATQQNQQQQN